ncbi:AmmeMemoRadiSam system protein B [Ferrimonas pelagia]|uniref:MEMO1 family protein GCM10023333_35160 n=1 Tax=Ferrimonas pelagia TaxID=1177826 RepID=A0ABP9FDL1_9GAMM
MSSTRPPAVAGAFYPDDPAGLNQQLDAFLSPLPVATPHSAPRALIVPHAGYVYSGAIAAHAFAYLAQTRYQRIWLLGPAHRVALRGIAAPSWAEFNTPLGPVPLDRHCLERLIRCPHVTVCDPAHQLEHCLEVQLPFLQRLLPGTPIVPLVVGQIAPAELEQLLTEQVEPDDLLIISTDLSHFHAQTEALQRDGETVRRILKFDAGLNGDDACGAYPLNGALRWAQHQGLSIHKVAQDTSARVNHDHQQVVGYAAFVLQ